MKRVGILGGTFNPPHLGHLHAAKTVREALNLDEVWLMPTQTPPHKPMPAGSPDAASRLEMVKLAAAGEEGLAASELELTLPPPSYTANTVRVLAQRYPDTQFWWIVGADMLLTLEKWYHPEVIFAHCRIAALARENEQSQAIREHAGYLRKTYGAGIDLVESVPYPMSSTQVREILAADARPEGIPAAVYDYILEKGLYRA